MVQSNLNRFARIPDRIWQDQKLIRLARNWRQLLAAKLSNQNFDNIELRNGVILKAPPEIALNFLFHEIWIDEVYAPSGYEINDGDTVVDIGANIGVFAMYAATRALGVKVKSYEPFPKNAEYFRANLEASKLDNVEFYQLAVAGSNGSRTLHVEDAWILHSLADKDSAEKGLDVECITLDKVFADVDRCDLLKLDCEGSEYEILYSASNETFGRISRIVCEFNNIDSERKNGTSLGSFLAQKGFEVEAIGPQEDESGFFCAKRV